MAQQQQPTTQAPPQQSPRAAEATSCSSLNSARGASARTALKGASYDQGQALLSPNAAPAPAVQLKPASPGATTDANAGKGGGASSFEGLKTLVTDLAGKVRSGQFAEANIKAAIPVPQVPGLSITVGALGSFTTDDKSQKELSVQLGVGVQYSLGSIFNVNGNFNEALTLRGNDLGAALVDAVKQSAYWFLERMGVHAKFNELVGLAKEGPGFWDYAKCLIPVYGTYQAAKLAVSSFGADRLIAAHQEFVTFFKNDGAVGFEASVGVGVGAAASGGGMGGSLMVEGRAGLEDVNDKQTKAFAELAGEIQANKGNSTVRVRFSKRAREGGAKATTIELNSALSMPKKAYDPSGSQGLMRDASLLWSIISFGRAVDKAKEGGQIGEVMNLIKATMGLGSNVFGNTANFDSLMGLDIKVRQEGGKWSVDFARIKSMNQIGTGTGVSTGAGIEANVRIGTFHDVGAVLNEGLTKLGA